MRNLSILTISQAIFFSYPSLFMLVCGSIGGTIAPHASLTVLPTALLFLGMGVFATPAGLVMKRFGRKPSFLISAAIGIGILLHLPYTIATSSFVAFCIDALILGCTISFVQHYRFAVIESAPKNKQDFALSVLLFGSAACAILGPFIATNYEGLIPSIPFSGSFLVMAALSSCALLILALYRPVEIPEQTGTVRSLREILFQAKFFIAVTIGGLCLTLLASMQSLFPTLMLGNGFTLSQAGTVMQTLVLMMFLPSMVSGYMMNKLGLKFVLALGIVGFAVTITLLSIGNSLLYFFCAAFILGFSWNLCFLGATTLVSTTYSDEETFKAQALNDGVIYGAQAVFPLLIGPLYFVWGWHAAVGLMVPAVGVMVGCWVWLPAKG